MERILQKLDRLRTLDTRRKISGASSHDYRMGHALSEREVASMEEEFGVRLPDDYRRFLIEAGHGGAGPYYGLFELHGLDAENITDYEDLAKEFPYTDAANPTKMGLPGALYLCTYGNALFYFLVVSGPCKGEVWRDWRADGGGLRPETDVRGQRMNFLKWYETWLDRSLRQLGSS